MQIGMLGDPREREREEREKEKCSEFIDNKEKESEVSLSVWLKSGKWD